MTKYSHSMPHALLPARHAGATTGDVQLLKRDTFGYLDEMHRCPTETFLYAPGWKLEKNVVGFVRKKPC